MNRKNEISGTKMSVMRNKAIIRQKLKLQAALVGSSLCCPSLSLMVSHLRWCIFFSFSDEIMGVCDTFHFPASVSLMTSYTELPINEWHHQQLLLSQEEKQISLKIRYFCCKFCQNSIYVFLKAVGLLCFYERRFSVPRWRERAHFWMLRVNFFHFIKSFAEF